MPQDLTAERLRELLRYDPGTGIFRWRVSTNRRIVVGQIAGTISHGRVQIKVAGNLQRAHRLAWLYVHGEWPADLIDHKNGDATDNRIANLRQADKSINAQNQRRANSRNKTGLLGVSPARWGGFRARIDHDYLGVFPTAEEAHQAYLKAKRERHPGGMI